MDVLMAPLHLEGLRLETPQRTLGPLARVDRLPWNDTVRVHNPDMPWLGPALAAPPFADPDDILDAGVHLHWTLPDGLTRASSAAGFPIVPDRWYVHRLAPAETAWVVESDFTAIPLAGVAVGQTLFPAEPDGGSPPWRIQGRRLALTDWTGAQDAVRSPPTAVGYGDPLFAAYYPSCRGLFGLHDPMPPQAAVTYEVLGWYSVAAEDPLATGPNADWLKARYHWIVPDQSPIAHRLVCYARVTIDAASVAATKPPPRVALGASSVSALAALSAAAAAPQRADEIELAMAALTHAAAIAQLDADQAAVLSAAAHESGFVAEAGGILWTLRPDNLPGAPAQAEPANLRNNPLPPTLAVHLDRLNLAQDAFDAAARALHAAREQLLADWSKLAMLLYPQRDQPATPLDPSVVHDFLLHGRGLDGIKAQAAALGTLDLPVEQGGLQVDATGALPVPFDAQGRLALPAAATATLAGRAAALARGSLRKLAVYNATALSGRRDGEPLLEVALPARDGHLLFDGKSALTLDQIEGWGPWPTLGDGRYLTALTIWLRVRPDGPGPLLSFGSHLAITLDANLRAVFQVGADDRTGLAAAAPLAEGQWANLVATYDAGTGARALYLDGVPTATDHMTTRPFPGLNGARRWPVLAATSSGASFEQAPGMQAPGTQATGSAPRFAGAIARAVMLPDEAVDADGIAAFLGRAPPPALRLARQTAPRFWRPRDPVIALDGAAARASGRHARGELKAHVVTDTSFDRLGSPTRADQSGAFAALSAHLDAIAKADPNDAGLHASTGAPWNPLAVEWETAFHPIAQSAGRVTPGYLTDNFVLQPDGPELVPNGVIPLLDQTALTSGRSILTPFANRLLDERRKAWTKTYGLDTDALPPEAMADYPDMQSQALGGFHEALLQHVQAFTLPPDDPLALTAAGPPDPLAGRAFATGAIREALGAARSGAAPTGLIAFSAARPNQPFVPVRAGRLMLRRLRLIDAFGQVMDVPVDAIARPAALARGAGVPANAIELPPRLAQPARLMVRWLSADTGIEDANDHPASSPVCGWLVANYLDDALAVYDAGGTALGEIAPGASGGWLAVPGGRQIAPERFDNTALTRTVRSLIGRDQTIIDDLLSAIRTSLQRILPSLDGTEPALALIAGRPLALVRARLRLELKGPPAIDQSWPAFALDLRGQGGDDGGVSSMRCPVRLGDRDRVDDGLVGFWREDALGLPTGPFHAPVLRADDAPGPGIVGSDAPGFALLLTPNGPSETVTMLIDPLARVHATCGLQPVKAITVPSEYYAPGLSAIETWTLAAPILTPVGKLAVPLPATVGAGWAWRARTPGGWDNLPPGALSPPRTDAALDARIEAREGWLILTRQERR